MSDLAFDGLAVFVLLLIGFAILSMIAAALEYAISRYRHTRPDQRELLPEPNTRTVVRRRGYQVPM